MTAPLDLIHVPDSAGVWQRRAVLDRVPVTIWVKVPVAGKPGKFREVESGYTAIKTGAV
jgi:hypothetical protein